MALRKNAEWYGSKVNKDKLKEKLSFFEDKTNLKIVNYYDKGNFCSGFMKENVIIEVSGAIFAISDSMTIFKNEDNHWEEYSV